MAKFIGFPFVFTSNCRFFVVMQHILDNRRPQFLLSIFNIIGKDFDHFQLTVFKKRLLESPILCIQFCLQGS